MRVEQLRGQIVDGIRWALNWLSNGTGQTSALVKTVLNGIQHASQQINEDDLQRAKNILKLRKLKSLLTGSGSCMADHMVKRGTETMAQYVAKVDAVSSNDISRVAKSLSAAKPNLVAVGDVRGVPATL